jgi:trehalose 6-phosphate phosphatase
MPAAASPPVINFDDLAILLDVDGTILDVSPTPQSVRVPPELPEVLLRLWQRAGGAVAFVSGRPIDDLDRIFSPLQLPSIGGHGAEMRLAADRAPTRAPALDAELKRRLARIAELDPGILVEDKGYSLALHYRLAPEKETIVRKSAGLICSEWPAGEIELVPGKAMIEIKHAGFGKASAVRELMTHPPFAGRRPVFIGDDVTDQGVFDAMPEFKGIAISVGERRPAVDYCFEHPADVRGWLDELSRTDALAFS